MRQDQYEKLQALTEKLLDAFLDEANPDAWPGAGVPLANMDQQTRGNRYWCKKNAAGTMSVLMKCNSLADVIRRQTAGAGGAASVEPETDEPDGLDGEIKKAEKEATAMLDRIQKEAAARR